MNVLVLTNFFPPDYIGGYELGCAQAVAALGARGHAVTVLASTTRIPVEPLPGVLRRLRSTDLIFDHRRMARASGRQFELRRAEANGFCPHNVQILLETLEECRPDVVYLWNLEGLGTLGLLTALTVLQVPVTWHLMDDVPAKASFFAGKRIPQLARLLSGELRANYLACSSRVVDEIEHGGFSLRGRAELVPNWVSVRSSRRERDYYPDGPSRLRLVFAGQLLPHKGIDVVFGAARDLVDRGLSNFEIHLYGEGEDARYRRLVHELDLVAYVQLLGRKSQEELHEAYWQRDVFLFPTWRREPFAFAPLEAAASGCVPVLSGDCGNAEWMVDGVDCLKVEPEPRALGAVLGAILEGRIPLAPLGRRARAVVERSFHIDRVAGRIEAALEAAAGLPSGRAGAPDDVLRLVHLGDRLLMDVFDTL